MSVPQQVQKHMHTVAWGILIDRQVPHPHPLWPAAVRAEMQRAIDAGLETCVARWPGFRIVDDVSYCRKRGENEFRLFRQITILEAKALQ